MNTKKIFAVGFNKTGTTSLHKLFQTLGFKSYHGTGWRSCENISLLNRYDCYSDGIPKDIPRLDNLFPGSKFILNVRDLESWVYSRLAHIESRKESGTFIGGHSEWDNTEYAIKSWIKQRNRHHLFVLSYFDERKEDLLVVNFIKDFYAAYKVAKFLGFKDYYEKPHENITHSKSKQAKYKKMLISSITDLEIPDNEIQYDIYCPSLESIDTIRVIHYDTSLICSNFRV